MTFELSPNQIAAAGAVVSSGIGWFVRQLWLRFNASEAHAEVERLASKKEIEILRQAKAECDDKHTQTAINLARVETALQQMQNCRNEDCPFVPPTEPKKVTAKVNPRRSAA